MLEKNCTWSCSARTAAGARIAQSKRKGRVLRIMVRSTPQWYERSKRKVPGEMEKGEGSSFPTRHCETVTWMGHPAFDLELQTHPQLNPPRRRNRSHIAELARSLHRVDAGRIRMIQKV